jgi:peptidoglycan hydrolase-like protein with peptidoglycan-binding domain
VTTFVQITKIMTTIQQIIDNNLSLSRSQLKTDRALVMEIQTKLANLGFYPGGGWIDGGLGELNSFSWRGFIDFCTRVGGVSIPSINIAIDPNIAKKLLKTKQVDSILNSANANTILEKLREIQNSPSAPIINGNTVASTFVARTINKSPFQKLINDYPTNLAQKPDGTSIVSTGARLTLPTGNIVNFRDYPDRGDRPTIDDTGLNFLASNISHACVCVGSFTDAISPIKAHWLGKNASESVNLWWSTTKFIGVLNTACQINNLFPNTDVDNCIIKSPKNSFHDLVKDMVSYQGQSSNGIGNLFKSFSRREDLSDWIRNQTGNSTVDFRGSYTKELLIINAKIEDLTNGKTVLTATELGDATTTNSLSAYDLVRLISMLGWHQHLSNTAKLPSAQWKSLESIVRAMGHDTARYVDVALETLGIVNLISEPVIISKVGWGDLTNNDGSWKSGSMTYAAFVKFVDRRTSPGKLRTFAFALRCPNPDGAGSFNFRDTRLATAVTEIVRRIFTEELA